MKTKILSIIALFFLILSTSAQIDRSVQPKPGPAPKINLGKPQTFELKNGLKVLVVENHKLPRASASLSILNRPIFEGDKAGVQSLVGSLLGTGSTNIDKDSFNEEVDYLGARVSFNAQGASMNSLSKYFPRVMELLADAGLHPIFTQEEFDKEVTISLENIKATDKSVADIAGRVKYALAYGKDHPYGEFSTQETVKNVSLIDVQNFYNNYFKPNNAYLVIIGDVKFKEVKKMVKKYFGKWKKGNIPSYQLPDTENVAEVEIDFIDMPNAVQSDVAVLSMVDFKMNNPDYHSVLLANQIFGGDFNSHLNMNLREAHGYTYGARSNISPNKWTASMFSAGAQVRNMVTDSTVIETMKELKAIRINKVTAEELQVVKASYVGRFVRNIEKPSTVARFALNIETNKLPADFYETYLNKLNAVTIEDINRVAQKYFSADNARIVVTGKALDVLPNLEKLPYKINYYDKLANKTSKPEMTKPIPEGVTKETVFNNYFKAIGGKEKIAEVKSAYNKSEATMQGMLLTLETKSMVPNKQSAVMTGMGMVLSKTVFDGEKGYVESRGMKNDMESATLEKSKSSSVPFPEIGHLTNESVSLEKIEPIDGSDAYLVKVDDDTTIYYDVASGLKLKQITEVKTGDQTMKQTFTFKNYKEVDGIKIPHSIEMSFGPQKFTFEVKEVKFNEGVSESDFQ